ncbi:hypothetical protein BS47DRAFT_1402324 [Hydnum rufescens UP504]|uniref:Uncharacterized protein n=1 Tax=Hydnum rufescens UP504 TaxID=1448309 RepID=A0A9P6DLS5_9AGAM|nr:hypothetical protein BS47DRAFT_1402324 [Hydnum rufescens UP504]
MSLPPRLAPAILRPPDLLHLFHSSCSINSILEQAPKNSVQLVRRFIGLTRGTPDSADACDSRYHTALFVGTFSLGNERSRRSQGVSLRAPSRNESASSPRLRLIRGWVIWTADRCCLRKHPWRARSQQGLLRNQLLRLDLALYSRCGSLIDDLRAISPNGRVSVVIALPPLRYLLSADTLSRGYASSVSFSILEELVVSVGRPVHTA